jgi:carboxymethylenebutenolidase
MTAKTRNIRRILRSAVEGLGATHRLSALLLLGVSLGAQTGHAAPAPETVAFPSGDKTLHGFLYRPAGKGPFPAVLYNHGGSPGLVNQAAFDAIAPGFTAKGWVFFAPWRRGQGLSEDAGQYVVAQIQEAGKQSSEAADALTVRLMSGEQLNDQLAGARWLEAQSFVQRHRIAVMGNSFGGIETVGLPPSFQTPRLSA